jgi:MFS family permease
LSAAALSPALARRALSRSTADGIAYAVMVGAAETYFLADVIHLGAAPFEIAAAVSLPLLCGALGPGLSLRILPRLGRRRPLVVAGALGQVLALALGALGNGLGFLDPLGLIAILGLYQLCGQAAGTAWSSWYGDLVPAEIRGRWFARRTRIVHLTTFLALCGGGALLHFAERGLGPGRGFMLLFALAALARAVSALLLAISPEPPFHGLQGRRALGRFLGTRRGRDALVLLGGNGSYQAAVYLSSAFFTPFMLDELGLDYLQYMAALGAQVGIKVLAMGGFGRLVDAVGAKGVYRTALLMTAAVPLPWVFVDGFLGVLAAQLLSGFAWAGHEVALFALMLDKTRAANRPQLFAAQSLCNAVGQVSGSAAGAALFGPLGYTSLFAAGVAARGLVAVVLPALLSPERPGDGRRRPPRVWRIVGFRAGPGVVHRPVLADDDPVGDRPDA